MRTKRTVLDGYYASGDHECFCFDRWDGPGVYYERFGKDYDARSTAYEENRVYPDDLLPEHPESYGRWTIIVDFEPLEPPKGEA